SCNRSIGQVLTHILYTTGKTGTVADIDGNLQRYTFNVPVASVRRYPTVRMDYNLSMNHRLSGTYNWQKFTDFPHTLNTRDNFFPDFPISAGQASKRIAFSTSLRSTLSRNPVNQDRGPATGRHGRYSSP